MTSNKWVKYIKYQIILSTVRKKKAWSKMGCQGREQEIAGTNRWQRKGSIKRQ